MRTAGFSSPLRRVAAQQQNAGSPQETMSPLEPFSGDPPPPDSQTRRDEAPFCGDPSESFLDSHAMDDVIVRPRRRGKKRGKGAGCTCQSSRCMKMYCECFASGTYCTDACGCDECQNVAENEDVLQRIRSDISKRNPSAFEQRLRRLNGAQIHKSGCKCTKTRCQKRYCECFRAGVQCSSECECVGCNNGREAFSHVPQLGLDAGYADRGDDASLLSALVNEEGFESLWRDPSFSSAPFGRRARRGGGATLG